MATGQKSGINNYLLVGIVLVLLIALAYFLTQQPSTSNTSSLPPSTTIQQITSIIGQTTPVSTIAQTSTVSQSFTPIGTMYCISGVDSISTTNSSYYSNIYNTTQFNASTAIYWAETTNYPISIENPTCVQNNGVVYCIGGERQLTNVTLATNAAYAAKLYPNGISNWTSSPSYPQPISSPSCVVSNDNIYCTGGQYGFNVTSNSYYSQLNSSSIVHWQSTNTYPQPLAYDSCVTNNGYMYCMGGSGSDGINSTNATYYAQLTSSGIGKWNKTTNYPINVVSPRCVQYSGYVYCIGNNPNFAIPNTTYFAKLTASGIGSWARTTNYPLNLSEPAACVQNGNIVYCTGGSDTLGNLYSNGYYAQMSQFGIGQWLPFSNYQIPIAALSCVAT